MGVGIGFGGIGGSMGTLLFVGFSIGLSSTFKRESRTWLIISAIITLIEGFLNGIEMAFLMGGASLITFFFMYFRCVFYPLHFFSYLFFNDFYHNSYLIDGVIKLPLWNLNRKLLYSAQQYPENAKDFSEFLLEYRPFQERLALQIFHAANSGRWQQQAIALNADALMAPTLPQNHKKLHPSENWLAKLVQLRTQLITSQTQTQIGLKKEAFIKFFELLEEFRTQTLGSGSNPLI